MLINRVKNRVNMFLGDLEEIHPDFDEITISEVKGKYALYFWFLQYKNNEPLYSALNVYYNEKNQRCIEYSGPLKDSLENYEDALIKRTGEFIDYIKKETGLPLESLRASYDSTVLDCKNNIFVLSGTEKKKVFYEIQENLIKSHPAYKLNHIMYNTFGELTAEMEICDICNTDISALSGIIETELDNSDIENYLKDNLNDFESVYLKEHDGVFCLTNRITDDIIPKKTGHFLINK